MARIALGSLRSSGVTTAALALARTWPTERSVLLAEADPAGGTLAATLGRHTDPGLQSLAADARRGLDPGAVALHTQPLSENAALLLAPTAGERVRASLAMLGDLDQVLGAFAGDLLVDCGRLDVASPVLTSFGAAELSLLIVRPELADLQALSSMIESRGLSRIGERLGLVVTGSGPYPPDEIADALAIPVIGNLPTDALGVRALVTDGAPRGLRARCPLLRSARSLADRLIGESSAAVEGSASTRIDPTSDDDAPAEAFDHARTREASR